MLYTDDLSFVEYVKAKLVEYDITAKALAALAGIKYAAFRAYMEESTVPGENAKEKIERALGLCVEKDGYRRMNPERFAWLLKHLMAEFEYTHDELAKALKVSKTTINKYLLVNYPIPQGNAGYEYIIQNKIGCRNIDEQRRIIEFFKNNISDNTSYDSVKDEICYGFEERQHYGTYTYLHYLLHTDEERYLEVTDSEMEEWLGVYLTDSFYDRLIELPLETLQVVREYFKAFYDDSIFKNLCCGSFQSSYYLRKLMRMREAGELSKDRNWGVDATFPFPDDELDRRFFDKITSMRMLMSMVQKGEFPVGHPNPDDNYNKQREKFCLEFCNELEAQYGFDMLDTIGDEMFAKLTFSAREWYWWILMNEYEYKKARSDYSWAWGEWL